jgi:hypothetical protein
VNREDVPRLVAAVIARVAPRLGADGRHGRLVVVFSGATSSLPDAIGQCRLLVLDGYELRLAFTPTAERFFGPIVREGLEGFPHVQPLDPAEWLTELHEARAVLCPMLSVNTLSRLSLLLADGLVPNLLLHGLFMGKPVVLARDGVDPADAGRRTLGIDQGTPALRQALAERLRTVSAYGGRVTDARGLRAATTAALSGPVTAPAGAPARALAAGPVVTAADVRRARGSGEALDLSPTSLVTPLARDLALQLGVPLTRNGRGFQ